MKQGERQREMSEIVSHNMLGKLTFLVIKIEKNFNHMGENDFPLKIIF